MVNFELGLRQETRKIISRSSTATAGFIELRIMYFIIYFVKSKVSELNNMYEIIHMARSEAIAQILDVSNLPFNYFLKFKLSLMIFVVLILFHFDPESTKLPSSSS